jgi:hypothetical protein
MKNTIQSKVVDMTQLPAGVYFAKIIDAEAAIKTVPITKISAKE